MDTYIDEQKDEFWDAAAVCGAYSALREASSSFSEGFDSFNKGIEDGEDSIEDFEKTMIDFRGQLYNDIYPQGDIFMEYIAIALYVYLVICILACFMILFGRCLVSVTKMGCWRCCNHLAWLTMGLFLIITFLLVTILFPVSIVIAEACAFLDDYFSEETLTKVNLKLLEYPNFPLAEGDIGKYVYTCFWGDYKLAKEFNIEENLVDLMEAQDMLKNITDSANKLKIAQFPKLNEQYTLVYIYIYINIYIVPNIHESDMQSDSK